MKKFNQIFLSVFCLGLSTILMGSEENAFNHEDEEVSNTLSQRPETPRSRSSSPVQSIFDDTPINDRQTPSTRPSSPIEPKPGKLEQFRSYMHENHPKWSARLGIEKLQVATDQKISNDAFNALTNGSFRGTPGASDGQENQTLEQMESGQEKKPTRKTPKKSTYTRLTTPTPEYKQIDFSDKTILREISNGRNPFETENGQPTEALKSIQEYGAQAKADLINKIVDARIRDFQRLHGLKNYFPFLKDDQKEELETLFQSFFKQNLDDVPINNKFIEYISNRHFNKKNVIFKELREELTEKYRSLIDRKTIINPETNKEVTDETKTNLLTYDEVTGRATPLAKYKEAVTDRLERVNARIKNEKDKDFSTKTILNRIKNGETLSQILESSPAIETGIRSYGIKAKERLFNDIYYASDLSTPEKKAAAIEELTKQFNNLLKDDQVLLKNKTKFIIKDINPKSESIANDDLDSVAQR